MAEKKGELIVISGPSGTGKGTLIHKLQQKENIAVSISCTTRTPRAGKKMARIIISLRTRNLTTCFVNMVFLNMLMYLESVTVLPRIGSWRS